MAAVTAGRSEGSGSGAKEKPRLRHNYNLPGWRDGGAQARAGPTDLVGLDVVSGKDAELPDRLRHAERTQPPLSFGFQPPAD